MEHAERAGTADKDRLWLASSVGAIIGGAVFGWLKFATGPVGTHNWLGSGGPDAMLGLGKAAPFFETGLLLLLGEVGIAAYAYLGRSIRTVTIAVALGIFTLVGSFAAIYLQAAHNDVHCFSTGRLSHVSALYVTLGNLTTGSGNINPTSRLCRGLVSIQLIIGIPLMLLALGAIGARLLEALRDARS